VPLAVSLPTRIGLSVPGRVGTNVKRNRIKRLIREAFRLNRAALPTGFDFVIGVHPHEEKTVEEYAGMLASAAESLAKTWEARRGVGGGGRR
jgi:ribonuclease P protein component